MASGALFGSSTSRPQNKHLVEFRAGKMNMKGKMVHADKRKGLLYIYQSDDLLMHFCWKERNKTNANAEDDLIIFPDDVEFKPVTQCTTGRVFLLKFKSTNRKMFFWMQEPKADKDDELCRKLNDFLNNPPTPGSSRASGGGLGGLSHDLAAGFGSDGDLQSALANMNQQQLMQLLSGMGGISGLSSLMGGRSSSAQSDSNPPSRVQSSPGARNVLTGEATMPARPVTAATMATHAGVAAPTSAVRQPVVVPQPRFQVSDLQNILSGLGAAPVEEPKEVDLSLALNAEAMIPILANAEVQTRLLPFLPEGDTLPRTEHELRQTVQSAQFQQALQSFSAALASGQLGPLMGQFGLGEDVMTAAAQGDVAAFARALQAASAEKKPADMEVEKKEEEEPQ